MDNKIAIIGNIEGSALTRAVAEAIKDKDVIVVSPENVADLSVAGIAQMKVQETKHQLEILSAHYDGTQFICKGKHQYREINNEWICQCGRKLNQ